MESTFPADRLRSASSSTAVAMLAAFVLVLSGCQSGGSTGSAGDTSTKDDGTTLTMWTRSPTATFSQTLIDAYNSGHRNKVKLTASAGTTASASRSRS